MSVKIDNGAEEGATGKNLLVALNEAQIFSIKKMADGRFCFEESCDRFFRANLTKKQVLRLADELRALVEA